MHSIQEKLLNLISRENIGNLTLRQIGGLIGENLPQKIKHHLTQLEQKGFITIDSKNQKITRTTTRSDSKNFLISIPILGSANCGPATIYAHGNIEGYLKVSKKLIPKQKDVFAIKAQGNSLNKANIKGKSVESGDFVIIDCSQVSPKDGDYVLCIIDGMANIKKFRIDRTNERLVLLSESSQTFHPIFIHNDDEFRINGKVIEVIKKFEE
jgi:repressor LexA